MAKRLKQRRHDFAPGQVAGTAKHNQVKTHGGMLGWPDAGCCVLTWEQAVKPKNQHQILWA